MKKIITILSGIVLSLIFVTLVSAATPNWNLKGTYIIDFTCTAGCSGDYYHTMTINVMNMTNGAFSGTGVWNNDASYTWNVTGTVDGSNVTFAIDYTGSNPSYAANATGTIDSNGMLSGSATSNAGQSFNWHNTTGKADMQPVAEITSPAADADVIGTLNLTATYTDDNPAGVQWAVREGTCAAATGTKAGNVDGFNTPYTWATTSTGKDFSASIDVSAWTTGDYCFVFNPGESALERDIRLTRLFDIITDADKDGYGVDVDCNDNDAAINPGATETCDGVDNDCDGNTDEGLTEPATNQKGVCSGSVRSCVSGNWVEPTLTSLPYYEATETRCDTLDNNCDGQVDEGDLCGFACINPKTDTSYTTLGLGVNRLIYDGNNWKTRSPKSKGEVIASYPTIIDTHNCGCEDILTWLSDNLPESYGAMNGHWKYGCSKSAIDDFIRLVSETESVKFIANDSQYFNGPNSSYPLYGNGPITVAWNPTTGHVTGGFWTERAPANTGTDYYNLITGGTISGGNVSLNFTRVNPDVRSFGLTGGTLSSNVLTGYVDGPYWFTATGTVSP